MCNVTFILEAPTRPVNAFHVLIVKEDLGLEGFIKTDHLS